VEASQSLTANTQNQVSAFCYDTAGNVLAEAGSQCPPAQGSGFTYNAENQLTFAGGTNYVYDGDGNRVEKYMLNTQGQTVFQELYWYGGGSASLDETDGTGSTTDSAFNEYVFFNGARTARRNTGGVYYYFADHLGTAREIVQSGSTAPCYDADFTPYGVEMPNTNTCPQNYKFTGKERDTESGLDNFTARYDASSMGRFMSSDEPFADQSQNDPRSWNLYSYVRNNPTRNIDPTGNNCVQDASGNWHDDGQGGQSCADAFSPSQNNKSSAEVTLTDEERAEIELSMAGDQAESGITGGVLVMATGLVGEAAEAGIGVLSEASAASSGAISAGRSSLELKALDANKLAHIFDNPAHNLGGLVIELGSKEAAGNALLEATGAAVQQQGLTGVFQVTVQVAGETITVRGNVVDGALSIGTAFK
jgi:RHS repeat-associated protein